MVVNGEKKKIFYIGIFNLSGVKTLVKTASSLDIVLFFNNN